MINDIITEKYYEYLKTKNVNKITFKNYKSDLNKFFNWNKSRLIKKGIEINTFREILPFINKDSLKEYKTYLTKISKTSTINRSLSSLRNLGTFLYKSQIYDTNIAEDILNIKERKSSINQVLKEYSKHLQKNNISANTVKNYTTDVRHFLTWINQSSHIKNA